MHITASHDQDEKKSENGSKGEAESGNSKEQALRPEYKDADDLEFSRNIL
jgi:hypothetical protein